MGYKIRVNGDVVWESEGDAALITDISVQTPRGEAGHVRVPPNEDVLDLKIAYRSLELAPHDLVEQVKRENPVTDVLHERFGGPAPDTANQPTESELEALEAARAEAANENVNEPIVDVIPADENHDPHFDLGNDETS